MAVDALAPILELAETDPVGAARDMALALMRGDADSYKAGYTAENAVLSAAQFVTNSGHDVTDEDVRRALVPDPHGDTFVAFLHYLADDADADRSTLIYAVEKPSKFWAQHADYLVSEMDNSAGVPTPLEA